MKKSEFARIGEQEMRKSRGDYVIGLGKAIEALQNDINDHAKAFFPKFHFLNHKVSTFWRCKDSPIGVCIFQKVYSTGRTYLADCIFCNQPVERK